MATGETTNLEQEWRQSAVTVEELYLRYRALTGMAAPIDFELHLIGVAPLPASEHNIIVQALNERFMELGSRHRTPYRDAGIDG